MPLVRIDMPVGRPVGYRTAVVDIVQSAMHTALGVPLAERFHVINEHGPECLSMDAAYLGVTRSTDAMIVQVTLNEGRDASVKQLFYRALADGLHSGVGLRREDLVISLVEVRREDWSFGNGEAQLA